LFRSTGTFRSYGTQTEFRVRVLWDAVKGISSFPGFTWCTQVALIMLGGLALTPKYGIIVMISGVGYAVKLALALN
jgi:hypothetical protein